LHTIWPEKWGGLSPTDFELRDQSPYSS